MYERILDLPTSGTETFFLWGPRQAGKSTLLKHQYADGLWLDLLKADEFRRYVANPEFLRQEIEATEFDPNRQIVIDEIQKSAASPVACLEPRARRTDDGIDILPATTFVQMLWSGDLA